MKSKTLLILLAVCAVLAAVTYFVLQKGGPAAPADKMGRKLLPDLLVNDIAAISITGPKSMVRLEKGASIWTAAHRGDYPADFSKIVEAVKDLAECKIGRSFGAKPDALARLGLLEPSTKDAPEDQLGTRITFLNKEGQTLADMLVGKTRKADSGYGGQYVKIGADQVVYLVDRGLDKLNKEAHEWIEKDLIDIEGKEIEKVVCFNTRDNSTVYELKRPKKGEKALLAGAPQGRELNDPKISDVMTALNNFRIEDVADASRFKTVNAIGADLGFTYFLYDGTKYTVYPGSATKKDAEQYYLKIRVAFQQPPEQTSPEPVKERPAAKAVTPVNKDLKPAAPKDAKEPPPPDPVELARKAKELDTNFSKRVYVIAQWSFEDFVGRTDDLLKKIDEKKTDG